MSTIARGSRSTLAFKPESTYGVAPGGNYKSLLFQNETLGETINTVQSQDMRPDRANPGLRGGNIAAGGAITMDLVPRRQLLLMQHLLATDPITRQLTGAGANPGTFTANTAYILGQAVTGETSSVWVCVRAGTTAIGATAADLADDNGGTEVTSGTAIFRPMVQPFATEVTFRRGQLVTSGTNLWLCARGGAVAAAQTLPASPSVGQQVELDPDSGTTLPPRFQFAGATSKLLYVHLFRGGTAWSAGGLYLQKSIIGGVNPLYLGYGGGRVNSMELTIGQEAISTAAFNMLFKEVTKLDSNVAGTPTLQADAPFAGLQAMISLNDPLGLGDALIREGSLTISNQADENTFIVGSRARADIPEMTRLCNGRVTVYFSNDGVTYEYFKNETVIPVTLDFAHNGLYLGFEFPEVKLTGNGTPQISGGGLLSANFDWTAFLQDAAYDVQLVALNDLATL